MEALNGGLYQTSCSFLPFSSFTLLVLDLFLVATFFSAMLYSAADSLKTSSLDEMFDSRFAIISGSCFFTVGGWFELLCMYALV